MAENKLIKITDKDWHYRLIKFCWGIDPMMFKNLCPYFWLSIASIFVCIPISLYKSIKWCVLSLLHGMVKLIDYIGTRFEDVIDTYSYDRTIENLTNGQIYYLCNYGDSQKVWEGDSIDHFRKIKHHGKNLDDFLNDVLKAKGLKKGFITSKYKDDYKREVANFKKLEAENKKALELRLKKQREEAAAKARKFEADEKKKKERERKMYEFTRKISSFTKNLFIWLMNIALFFAFFLFTNVLTYLMIPLVDVCSGVDWASVFITGLKIVALVSSCVFASYILYKCILKYIEMHENRSKYTGFRKYFIIAVEYTFTCIYKILFYIVYYLLWCPIVLFLWKTIIMGIFGGLVEGFNEFGGIFRDYFNASYSDYCPGIEWEETSNK